MRPMILFSADKALALCSVFFIPAAAFADPPHFLSDSFAPPLFQPAAPAQKPLYRNPNDHLERIPKCELYFDYRVPGPSRVAAYRFIPMPKMLLAAKKPRQINPPQAAGASSPSTR
jgi:hypothetical protein